MTRDSGPAMTWGMHAIGHLELGDNEQAAVVFNRSYAPYVREPFKVSAKWVLVLLFFGTVYYFCANSKSADLERTSSPEHRSGKFLNGHGRLPASLDLRVRRYQDTPGPIRD